MSPVHSVQTVRSRSARSGRSSSRSARSGRSSIDYMRTVQLRLSRPVRRQRCCWRAVPRSCSQLPRSAKPSYGNKSRSQWLAPRVAMVVSFFNVAGCESKFHNAHSSLGASTIVLCQAPLLLSGGRSVLSAWPLPSIVPPRSPRKPRSHACCQLSRAEWQCATTICKASGSCSARISSSTICTSRIALLKLYGVLFRLPVCILFNRTYASSGRQR